MAQNSIISPITDGLFLFFLCLTMTHSYVSRQGVLRHVVRGDATPQ